VTHKWHSISTLPKTGWSWKKVWIKCHPYKCKFLFSCFLTFLWNIITNNVANKYNPRTCQGSCLQGPISKYRDCVNFSSTLNHNVPDFSEHFWKCSCMSLTWPHCSHSVWHNNYKYSVLLHHVVNMWCQSTKNSYKRMFKIKKKCLLKGVMSHTQVFGSFYCL